MPLPCSHPASHQLTTVPPSILHLTAVSSTSSPCCLEFPLLDPRRTSAVAAYPLSAQGRARRQFQISPARAAAPLFLHRRHHP
ncbi:hypothetical protein M0R45_015802 [Rubus argutus]|uniref:Uncharacterized protein n=1 Tax=Rubus argutus TaxID=59490 RepID=A0AAW1XRM2_RUBAR